MQCARHPDTETGLSCGRCDTPICPKCAVMTDVGARCPTCAPSRTLPQFELSPLYLLRAVGAAAVSGVVMGIVWGILLPVGFGFFSIFVGMGVGWAISEPVSLATNRKSGTTVQIVASAGVLLAFFTRNVVADGVVIQSGDLFGYVALVVGIVVAVNRLRF